MNLIEKILTELSNPKTKIRYKGMQVNLFGIPVQSKDSFKTTTSRMCKIGLIENNNGTWHITQSGKEYLKKKEKSLRVFGSPFKEDAPKNLLIMYDIPEPQKAERDWFRFHLKKFNFTMIQKSVWVGPSPIPKDFEIYLEKIKLKEKLKTFKLAKPYKIPK